MNKSLFAPTEGVQLISSAKLTGSQFNVINMTENDFFSVAKLKNFVINDTHSATGQRINWTKISNITYTLSEPLNLCVDYFNKRSAVHLLSNQDVSEFQSTALIYSSKGGSAISKLKYDNLQTNLKIIPNEYHEFYKSIKFTENVLNQDFALASYDSNNEEMDSDGGNKSD